LLCHFGFSKLMLNNAMWLALPLWLQQADAEQCSVICFATMASANWCWMMLCNLLATLASANWYWTMQCDLLCHSGFSKLMLNNAMWFALQLWLQLADAERCSVICIATLASAKWYWTMQWNFLCNYGQQTDTEWCSVICFATLASANWCWTMQCDLLCHSGFSKLMLKDAIWFALSLWLQQTDAEICNVICFATLASGNWCWTMQCDLLCHSGFSKLMLNDSMWFALPL
jgi:hypothetical protein